MSVAEGFPNRLYYSEQVLYVEKFQLVIILGWGKGLNPRKAVTFSVNFVTSSLTLASLLVISEALAGFVAESL